MASVSVFLKNPKAKKSSIAYKIRDGRSINIVIPAGLSIEQKYWSDSQAKRAKGEWLLQSAYTQNELGQEKAREITKTLRENKNKIYALYLAFNRGDGVKEGENAKNYIERNLLNEKKEPQTSNITGDVLRALDLFPETHKNKSISHRRKARKVRMHLSYFCQLNGIKHLNFSELDRARLHEYDNYLVSNTDHFAYENKLIKKRPQSAGSRKDHFKILKSIAKYSQGNIDINQEIFKYSISEEDTKKARALGWSEIQSLLDYNPKNLTEELTKDVFLFSCFSGLRITAIQELKISDIAGGFIHWINTKKNNKPVESTSIHRFSAPIISKYKAINERGSLFPPIAQQTLNNAIKTICKAVEIERSEEVHNHTGRHSYNSLLYALGIDTFIRNEELGHTHSGINEKVYTRLDEQERKAIIIRTMDRLEDILKERKQQYVTTYDNL